MTGFFRWLPDQGSNLDSSDPESDVLPVTPSGNGATKLTTNERTQNASVLFLYMMNAGYPGR